MEERDEIRGDWKFEGGVKDAAGGLGEGGRGGGRVGGEGGQGCTRRRRRGSIRISRLPFILEEPSCKEIGYI